jgi:hypothetical protein
MMPDCSRHPVSLDSSFREGDAFCSFGTHAGGFGQQFGIATDDFLHQVGQAKGVH